uniref:MANSC domain-containing protein n=1 Tax=Xenopus tropicalis TaxID=8364 RepID=A0A1B8Y956_XENTR|eukprot:XP_004912556.1 PREDICTED: MANSC domain-containing protein 1 isoform X1 [Xenopus tropicalis]
MDPSLALFPYIVLLTVPFLTPCGAQRCLSRPIPDMTIAISGEVLQNVRGTDPLYAANAEECAASCCAEHQIAGHQDCNLYIFDSRKINKHLNCYLFHCPTPESCPLKRSKGVTSFRILPENEDSDTDIDEPAVGVLVSGNQSKEKQSAGKESGPPLQGDKSQILDSKEHSQSPATEKSAPSAHLQGDTMDREDHKEHPKSSEAKQPGSDVQAQGDTSHTSDLTEDSQSSEAKDPKEQSQGDTSHTSDLTEDSQSSEAKDPKEQSQGDISHTSDPTEDSQSSEAKDPKEQSQGDTSHRSDPTEDSQSSEAKDPKEQSWGDTRNRSDPKEDSQSSEAKDPKEQSQGDTSHKSDLKEDSQSSEAKDPKEQSRGDTSHKSDPKEDSQSSEAKDPKEQSRGDTSYRSDPKEDSESSEAKDPKEQSWGDTSHTSDPKEDSESSEAKDPKEQSRGDTSHTSDPKKDSQNSEAKNPKEQSQSDTSHKSDLKEDSQSSENMESGSSVKSHSDKKQVADLTEESQSTESKESDIKSQGDTKRISDPTEEISEANNTGHDVQLESKRIHPPNSEEPTAKSDNEPHHKSPLDMESESESNESDLKVLSKGSAMKTQENVQSHITSQMIDLAKDIEKQLELMESKQDPSSLSSPHHNASGSAHNVPPAEKDEESSHSGNDRSKVMVPNHTKLHEEPPTSAPSNPTFSTSDSRHLVISKANTLAPQGDSHKKESAIGKDIENAISSSKDGSRLSKERTTTKALKTPYLTSSTKIPDATFMHKSRTSVLATHTKATTLSPEPGVHTSKTLMEDDPVLTQHDAQSDRASKSDIDNFFLEERNGLVAALVFGVVFLLVVIGLVGRKVSEVRRRYQYNKLDYLINGMYVDT